MGRDNKIIDLAAATIVGSDELISAFEKFLSVDNILGITETPEIIKCKELYSRILEANRLVIRDLAKIEETVVQLRCKEYIPQNFKLSLVRDYIYARAQFYRPGKRVKDIRIVAGRAEEYGTNLNELMYNQEFVHAAQAKLKTAMENEINRNMITIDELYEKMEEVYVKA